MKEVWKWIPCYKNYYKVSNLGRVKSTERKVKHNFGGWKFVPRRYLKLVPRNGYRTVTLSKKGVTKNFDVHILVLETFVSPCPEGMECCHRDDVRHNNNLSNLRWGTHKENGEDMSRNWVKLTDQQMQKIRIRYKRNSYYGNRKRLRKILARKFEVSETTIKNIVFKRTFTAI